MLRWWWWAVEHIVSISSTLGNWLVFPSCVWCLAPRPSWAGACPAPQTLPWSPPRPPLQLWAVRCSGLSPGSASETLLWWASGFKSCSVAQVISASPFLWRPPLGVLEGGGGMGREAGVGQSWALPSGSGCAPFLLWTLLSLLSAASCFWTWTLSLTNPSCRGITGFHGSRRCRNAGCAHAWMFSFLKTNKK